MAKGYIYVIKCPITDTIVYVGRSIHPKFRLMQHYDQSSNIGSWVRAMRSIGLIPVLEIIDKADVGIASLEKYYIEKLTASGQAIHNKMCNRHVSNTYAIKNTDKKADNHPSVIERKRLLLAQIKFEIYNINEDKLINKLPVYAFEKIYQLLNEKAT